MSKIGVTTRHLLAWARQHQSPPQRLFVVFATYILLCTTACQTLEPIHLIGGCLAPSIDSVRASGKVSETRCDFSRAVLLIAVPSTQPSLKELLSAGVSEDAALSVLSLGASGDRWCTADKLEPQEVGIKPGWTVQCSPTDVEIDTVAAITSKSTLFVLGPSKDKKVRLVELRALN